MTNGCIVSDWDGEACGYTWVGNKDVLASSEEAGADIFDFNSMRPSINEMKNKPFSLDVRRASNILRCDAPSKGNINNYQKFAKENENTKIIVINAISGYLRGITRESSMNSKSNLFTAPDNNSQTKAYLVSADKVKIIQNSPDNKWVNIGYVNAKGTPLVAWVKADTLVK